MPWGCVKISETDMKFVLFALGFLIQSHAVHAESFFCKKFRIGCYTEKERESEIQRCKNLANEIYQEALTEALIDSTKWRFNGNTSAQDSL